MGEFQSLYEQYSLLKEKLKEDVNDFSADLRQYGITEDYYRKVDDATELLCKFYDVKLANATIKNALAYKLNDNHTENVKICLLIDVLRCYEGLSHPTTFTTPEGTALLLLLDKILGNREIKSFAQLGAVSSPTLSLIDIIPYISECSEGLGEKYSLYLPTILENKSPENGYLYRRLIYNLCKTIAEVDSEISEAEEDWLNEIALLNDHNPNNDILLSGKICTFAHVTRVFFATSKVTKEAEIPQEGFSLIFRRVKLLPDSNNFKTFALFRHFMPNSSIEQFAVGMLVAFYSIASPGSPLLEEEGCALSFALAHDVKHPLFFHRPCLWAALTTYDNPFYAFEVYLSE